MILGHDMDTAQTLVRIMNETAQKAAKDREPSVCVGTVTGVNPLRVKIGDAYEIDESFMRIGALCRRNVIKIPTNESVKHLHEIDEKSLKYTAIGNLGAPIQFAPMDAPMKPNPNFNPNLPEDPVTNPREIPDMSKIPNPTVLDVSHAHTEHSALPEILVWRGVRVGDSVLVIRFQGGSLHYIMERLDGVSNDGSETKDDETIDNPEKEEQL